MGVQEQAAGTVLPTPPALHLPGPQHLPGQPNRHIQVLLPAPFPQPPTPQATASHSTLSDGELAVPFNQHWVLGCLLHELHWAVEKNKIKKEDGTKTLDKTSLFSPALSLGAVTRH